PARKRTWPIVALGLALGLGLGAAAVYAGKKRTPQAAIITSSPAIEADVKFPVTPRFHAPAVGAEAEAASPAPTARAPAERPAPKRRVAAAAAPPPAHPHGAGWDPDSADPP